MNDSVYDKHPLINNEIINNKTNSVPIVSRQPSNETEEPQFGQEWPCGACAVLLGTCHLTAGLTLIIFDVITNHVSGTAFAISASLSYIICAILAFIGARRLDRAAQLMLVFFTLVSLAMSLALFFESGVLVSKLCTPKEILHCSHRKNIVHTFLLCLSLMETVFCTITLIVCFRSLRRAYFVPEPGFPYGTLIAGNFRTLRFDPPILTRRSHLVDELLR
uniref:Uncharacterized protein n=1 Tax=Acrobeloides nanus TaxID=290746 RepID=A0A914CZ82_9BILA